MNRKILVPVFFLVAVMQIYVPAKMIFDNENILETGIEYKFKTAPVDPSDPFRGKYIILSYDENTITVPNGINWLAGETIYVSFITGNNGFARIKSVSKKKPIDQQDFLKAKVSFATINDSTSLTIDYPFDRYYMEESKAYDAEQTYWQAQLDTNRITYALVSIKNGGAVLKDVLIDGISIREIVKSSRENKK